MTTKRFIINLLILGTLVATPVFFLHAQTTPPQDSSKYTLLEPLPLGPGGDTIPKVDLSTYLSELFRLVIILAGALAVFRLIQAGVIYMSTDAFSKKSEAKGIINDTLMGLGLVLGSWIIVATIMPEKFEGGVFSISLSIPTIKSAPNINPAGGTGKTGCQGTCPYSYTNGGTIIQYKDCASCSPATSFGLDIKTKSVNGKNAQINTALGNKLKAVSQTPGNPGFRVTETWPPTVNHAEQGQYDGTSVDVSLHSISTANINNFIKNAQAQGLKATYEVSSAGQFNSYVAAGVPAGNMLVVPYISGEHFSVK